MTFDFSYQDKYPYNSSYDDLKDYIYFEIYGDYEHYHYFLINGKLVESDEEYDQQTAPRMYFCPMESNALDAGNNGYYIPKKGCEHVVYLGNNHQVLMNYLTEHPDAIENYIKYRYDKFGK